MTDPGLTTGLLSLGRNGLQSVAAKRGDIRAPGFGLDPLSERDVLREDPRLNPL
jgi:hypothetical protein